MTICSEIKINTLIIIELRCTNFAKSVKDNVLNFVIFIYGSKVEICQFKTIAVD